MKRRNERSEQGFSLVEALVSLAIVAAVTGGFYQLLGSNASARRSTEERRMALLVAQSALDLAAVMGPRAPTARSGRSVGYVWQTRGVPAQGFSPDAMHAEEIEVVVRRETSPRPVVSLRTIVARP